MSSRQRFMIVPAVHVLLVKDNGLFLLRRANTGHQDGKYGLPAGHVDGNEAMSSAAAREAKEEAGVIIHPHHLKSVHVMHRKGEGEKGLEWVDWIFEANEWEGEARNCEPHKCDDLSWFSFDALPDNTIPYIRHVIASYRQGLQFSEFGW